jgi:hypothetical protein
LGACRLIGMCGSSHRYTRTAAEDGRRRTTCFFLLLCFFFFVFVVFVVFFPIFVFIPTARVFVSV